MKEQLFFAEQKTIKGKKDSGCHAGNASERRRIDEANNKLKDYLRKK